jgi:hypothetical protein
MDTCLKGWVAKSAVKTADVTSLPAKRLRLTCGRWTGIDVLAIHHGFDSNAFFAGETPLDQRSRDNSSQRRAAPGCFLSATTTIYRNFETLIRGFARAIEIKVARHSNWCLPAPCDLMKTQALYALSPRLAWHESWAFAPISSS